MEIYRSAGVATIAALIGPDRDDQDRCRLIVFEPSADNVGSTVEESISAARPVLHGNGSFSQIGRRCERAVVTAYRELRGIGTADLQAFRACTTLYRIHHPDASIDEARRLVAEWVDHHVIRGDSGPTSGCECADD